MKKLAIAVAASALFVVPAVAQQSQGSSVGNTLQNIGRSLNGQGSEGTAPENSRQYRQNTAQQYRSESNQQLQQDNQRLQEAQNRLDSASQALHQEMRRRGMTAEGNGGGSGYSGSSVPPGTPGTYEGGDRGYNQNTPYNNNGR